MKPAKAIFAVKSDNFFLPITSFKYFVSYVLKVKEFENVELLDRNINNCGAIIEQGDFDVIDIDIQLEEHGLPCIIS